jgi:very-short-patch-repair endonuclease
MAAVLACGPGALLSQRDAAAQWNISPPRGKGIDVLVIGRSRRRQDGINVHCVRSFDTRDGQVLDGIPVTGVARTLFDLAAVVNERQLRYAWEQAERLRLLDTRQVERLCDGATGRRGLGTLRELLADRSEPSDIRSKLEQRFREFRAAYDLPLPAFNVVMGPYTVDALWVKERLVVELDSRAFHSDPEAFERDRERDAYLQVRGYRVMRITWRRLERQPAAVAHQMRALLSLG